MSSLSGFQYKNPSRYVASVPLHHNRRLFQTMLSCIRRRSSNIKEPQPTPERASTEALHFWLKIDLYLDIFDFKGIDSSFQAESLEPGNVYFLNTQKLGSDKLLTHRSDQRQFTIWEALTNAATQYPNQLYVVIDEAHRGMNISSRAENAANSIMQKFIVGSEADGLCAMPLIIGITATPQRFQRMIAETTATKHSVVVSPDDVVASGLLKDRVIIHCPEIAINAEMTMFQEAVTAWKRMGSEWKNYCEAEQERLVKPILVVQVNDRTDSVATTTDINTCLDTLEEELGRPLEIGEVVHTFNDEGTLNGFSIPIVKIDPSKIEEEEKVLLVFFKMNLSTGWDCPRAEVMMSFRSAQDHTYIAQLLGRMVRTPLAHRIEMNDTLNAVHLFLPFFDQNTVSDVVRAFKEDENAAPTEAGLASEMVTYVRNPLYEEVFEHMNDLVTYRVEGIRKESNLRRLDKLRAYITVDGINRAVDRDIRRKMSQKLKDELSRIQSSQDLEAVVASITGMSMKTLEVELATNQVVADGVQNISIAQPDTEALYKKAEKTIGDYIAMQYRVENSRRDDMEVKVELIVLASDVTAMDNLEQYAGVLFDETYNDNRRAIQILGSSERDKYERLVSSGSSATPLQWRAPFSISFNCTAASSEYENHLYVDDSGKCRTLLNSWEDGVIQEELSRPDFVAWLRNLDRKNWSIEIPYKALRKELKQITDTIADNTSIRKFIEKMSLWVKAPDDTKIPVNEDTIIGLDDNNDFLISRKHLLTSQIAKLEQKIENLRSMIYYQSQQPTTETLIESFDKNLSQIAIDAKAVTSILNELIERQTEVRRQLTELAKNNNDILEQMYSDILSYGVELGLTQYMSSGIGFVFTRNLKELTGATLMKMVFAFKMSYIRAVDRVLNIKLPLILDSPSGKELDQYNIQKLMDIINRDFSENQVIIASIYHYKIDNLTTIEMGRRIVC